MIFTLLNSFSDPNVKIQSFGMYWCTSIPLEQMTGNSHMNSVCMKIIRKWLTNTCLDLLLVNLSIVIHITTFTITTNNYFTDTKLLKFTFSRSFSCFGCWFLLLIFWKVEISFALEKPPFHCYEKVRKTRSRFLPFFVLRKKTRRSSAGRSRSGWKCWKIGCQKVAWNEPKSMPNCSEDPISG